MEFIFGDFSAVQIIILIIAAILIGINKTGIPGLGLIPVIMLVFTFEAGISTGLQLMMLCMADLAAVAYYHKTANWKIIAKLLPAALCGIVIGSCVIHKLDSTAMMLLMGIVILILSGVSVVREIWWNDAEKIPSHWSFAVCTGLLAGFSTQIANAAGPIMALYLLAMRLPKMEYMGTAAWYFMILNWIKLPIFAWEGRITMASVKADLAMIPFLLIGAILGIVMLNKMPKKVFDWFILILSAIASVYMIVKSVI